jgi:Domain of unknown function (DUF4440)
MRRPDSFPSKSRGIRPNNSKDTRALNLLLADTLSYVDYDGTLMNKPQFLASARDRMLHPALITDESIRAHIYEQSAVVAGVSRETGTNKKKPYERRGRFTDTWVKSGNTWQWPTGNLAEIVAL